MDSPILKAWEACDKIDTLFIIFCTTICWTIVPTVSLCLLLFSRVVQPPQHIDSPT